MWTLGNTRIFVQQFRDDVGQIIPRLQPLNGGSVHQVFGYETSIVGVDALVVGQDDFNHLKTLTMSGVAFSLESYDGVIGNFLVKKVTGNRLPTVYQTIRQDLDCEAPLFDVSLELFLET